ARCARTAAAKPCPPHWRADEYEYRARPSLARLRASRPGGNATGFIAFEFSLNAKLLDLLKEVAPGTARVAVVRDAFVPAGSAGFAAIQTAASSLGVELVPIGVRDADEIEHGIAEFASRSNGGLIVVGPPSSVAPPNRDLLAKLTIQHHLPAIYATAA